MVYVLYAMVCVTFDSFFVIVLHTRLLKKNQKGSWADIPVVMLFMTTTMRPRGAVGSVYL